MFNIMISQDHRYIQSYLKSDKIEKNRAHLGNKTCFHRNMLNIPIHVFGM